MAYNNCNYGFAQDSETYHQLELNHFQFKFKREKCFRMSEAEKANLASAIRKHPDRNHRPTREGNAG